jgi:hypothetical protein
MVLLNWDSTVPHENRREVYSEIIIRFSTDNPDGEVLRIAPSSNIRGAIGGKRELNLSDWRIIEFSHRNYRIFDQRGNFTWGWPNTGTLTGFELLTSENFTIELNDIQENENYIAVFYIYDTQGNQHITNPVRINYKPS